jgi:hypothetical protein
MARNPNELIDLQRDAYVSRLREHLKIRSADLVQETRQLIRKATGEEKERLQGILDDCSTILDIVEDRRHNCETEFYEIHRRYARAKAPHKGETATLWYKMRLFTLGLWDKWSKLLQ